jgi:uncharacterized protein YmfQ (DUF2313 family)
MASFIDDIKLIADTQQAFVPNLQNVNTQSIANYLPNGPFYAAKNLPGSNFRKMLESLALEFGRKEKVFQTIADQYYPFTTNDFLEEWEAAVRIPDDCFSATGISLEQRRKQVIAKLVMDNIITKDDFIALADFFGFTITIDQGITGDTFPMQFPATLSGTAQENKFIIRITFISPGSSTDFLECFIQKLVPANVLAVFVTTP